jgi:glutamyl-tRNA reductase
MSPVAVASVMHGNAPLSILERVSYRRDEIEAVLAELAGFPGITGATILSTCNRTEIYGDFTGPVDPHRLAWFLAESRGVCWADLRPVVRMASGRDVAHHLFRVASGLESLVVGEREIQGQVRSAYALAREARSLGSQLEGLFRWAVRVGRRVRRDSAFGNSGASIGRRSVEVAERAAGGLIGRQALVVGAGKISEAVVRRIQEEGACLAICSRKEQRAIRVAGLDAGTLPLTELWRGLEEADVVICCTAAPGPLIGQDAVQAAMERRATRPLIIVDLSMPRNVDPSVRSLPGVRLFDLEDLGREGLDNASTLGEASKAAEEIVDEETDRYVAWMASQEAGPIISALRKKVEEVFEREFRERFHGYPTVDEELVRPAIRSAVAKLLHGPTVLVKEAAVAGDSRLLADICRAFGLGSVGSLPVSSSLASSDESALDATSVQGEALEHTESRPTQDAVWSLMRSAELGGTEACASQNEESASRGSGDGNPDSWAQSADGDQRI